MPRGMTPAVLAASQAEVVRIAWLVYLDYPGDPVYANTTILDLPHDPTPGGGGSPVLFRGVGQIGGIGQLLETGERRVQRLTLTMQGIDPDLVQKHVSAAYYGREGYVWKAFLDEDWRIIPDPLPRFAGRMIDQQIELGGMARITITLGSIEEDWERIRDRVYDHADQTKAHPGDLFFEHIDKWSAGREIKVR